MVEFTPVPIAEQLGITGADPFRITEGVGLFLLSGASDQPANTIAPVEGGIACWLAPDRALVIGAAPATGFVSDVTHGIAVFEIPPPHDLDILAMGCALEPDAVAEGHCAQTLFAGVKVLVYRHNDTLRLHVDRALAPYLCDWLRQTATSF